MSQHRWLESADCRRTTAGSSPARTTASRLPYASLRSSICETNEARASDVPAALSDDRSIEAGSTQPWLRSYKLLRRRLRRRHPPSIASRFGFAENFSGPITSEFILVAIV